MASGPQSVTEGVLLAGMWSYAAAVLYPAQALRRAGLAWWGTGVVGMAPEPPDRAGLGPHFSEGQSRPRLLERSSEHQHLVDEFDRMAEVYQAWVEPFSRPIFDEALSAMSAYLKPDSRVLDAGCGPGRELRRLARAVPKGEVVGIDLAAGMVNAAHAATRAHGLDNCAFFQADVSDLPKEFAGAFDLVYSSLAHHHYPDTRAATESLFRCLRPGGIYCVVDPGPAWFNAMSSPISKIADPGWIGFNDPVGFARLFTEAGFERAGWLELLPGFGMALGQKANSAEPARRAGAPAATPTSRQR